MCVGWLQRIEQKMNPKGVINSCNCGKNERKCNDIVHTYYEKKWFRGSASCYGNEHRREERKRKIEEWIEYRVTWEMEDQILWSYLFIY